MGWANGSELLEEVFDIVLPNVAKDQKYEVIEGLVDAFEAMDCDTISELSNYDDEAVRTYFADRYSDCDE